jgi:hypothetical protein
LEGEAAKVGLKINEQKTKYMIAARNDTTIRDVGQSVAIGDKVLLRTAQTSAVEAPFTPDKIHHSQDLDPPSPALRQ